MVFLMQICIFNIQRAPENSTLNFHTYINEYFFSKPNFQIFHQCEIQSRLDCTFIL